LLVAEIVGGDFEPREFESNLNLLIENWVERKAEPLRVVGVGATKKMYGATDGGSSGGSWGGGFREGGSRSIGE